MSGELEVLEPTYEVFTPEAEYGEYRCRSVVAVRRDSDLNPEPFTLRSAGYHGSYVASARIELEGLAKIAVMSVHASPARLRPADIEKWQGADWPTPRPTSNGEDDLVLASAIALAKNGGLWDSDFVLASVLQVQKSEHRVLAAGDWNEARAWDADQALHPGHWGSEFFDAIEAADLCDCTFQRWDENEHPTCGEYQLDHVIASPDVNARITALRAPRAEGASDHFPVRFSIHRTAWTTKHDEPRPHG